MLAHSCLCMEQELVFAPTLSCENHTEQATGTQKSRKCEKKKGKKLKEICLCIKYTIPHLLPRVPVQSSSKLHTVCVVNKQQLLYLCTFVY